MGKCRSFFLPANILVIGNHSRRFCFCKEVRLIVKSPGINPKLETHLLFALFAITDGSVLMDRQSHTIQTFKHLFAIKTDVDIASLFGRQLTSILIFIQRSSNSPGPARTIAELRLVSCKTSLNIIDVK